ncbi:uncharacterized protein Hap1MRO34_002919 isoform 2-T2 [Clarias gariepinus]|uniref:uncharacterized protein LOC128514080 isoform X3 n=1 Tax=Clarias gariepinus TaxID=13013 RepID=UPI00234C073B|nr:uncharacterized protein LOC128514080 isoform X3 [Clarias gariepinus]
MEYTGFMCLLLCVSVHTASSVKQSCQKKNICLVKCGDKTEDSVTWSRDVDGKREKTLTVYNAIVTKHINDTDTRYSSGPSLILSIFGFSHSDSGQYYCNENTVELSVIAKTGTSTQDTTRTVQWMLIAAVAGGFVFTLASVLVLWRCLSKKKAGSSDQLPLSEDTYTTQSVPQPGSSNYLHFYESLYWTPSAPQTGDGQQNPGDGIYYLATQPGIKIMP